MQTASGVEGAMIITARRDIFFVYVLLEYWMGPCPLTLTLTLTLALTPTLTLALNLALAMAQTLSLGP